MTLVLDAGAFLACERRDRQVLLALRGERMADRDAITHGGILGQVWRDGRGRQAGLAQVLRGIDVRSLDAALGRRAGALLARDGDEILTSDPDDLRVLAEAAGVHVDLIPV